MRETRTSSLMSGDGKRSVAERPKQPRPSSTLLARWLQARGIEVHVFHTTSVAVSREHRRAKTDRLDAAMLMRVFLGWLRGERGHCLGYPKVIHAIFGGHKNSIDSVPRQLAVIGIAPAHGSLRGRIFTGISIVLSDVAAHNGFGLRETPHEAGFRFSPDARMYPIWKAHVLILSLTTSIRNTGLPKEPKRLKKPWQSWRLEAINLNMKKRRMNFVSH